MREEIDDIKENKTKDQSLQIEFTCVIATKLQSERKQDYK